MTQGAISQRQAFYLIEATETSVFLSVEGLIALGGLSAANDFAHLPLQLLAQGTERLLKVAWALMVLDESGELPLAKDARTKFGHNVVALMDEVVMICRRQGYPAQSRAAVEDIEYMDSDPLLADLVQLLSDLGQRTRYFELDGFLDPESVERASDPRQEFSKIEMGILKKHPSWEAKIGEPGFEGFYGEVLNPTLIAVMRRLLRAMARLFTLGPASQSGRFLTGTIQPLLSVTDEELGRPPTRWFES